MMLSLNTKARFDALQAALDQFVENERDREEDEDFTDADRERLAAAESILDEVNVALANLVEGEPPYTEAEKRAIMNDAWKGVMDRSIVP